MSEHRTLTGASLHEPKGADTATVGQVYIADGLGGGQWTNTLSSASDLKIERLLDGLSTATSQEPSTTDTPIQIEFGAAVNTVSDPVMLDAVGKLTFNEAGTYRLKVSTAMGRTGGSGVSELYLRVLINGTPAGQTIHAKIGSADSYTPFSDEAWLTLPAGVEITYELIRDSSGSNSGGLFKGEPSAAGWVDNPSAAIRVERWSA